MASRSTARSHRLVALALNARIHVGPGRRDARVLLVGLPQDRGHGWAVTRVLVERTCADRIPDGPEQQR
jgi:hypothetical protein